MNDIRPYVSRLLVYPIKSLDGVAVEQVTVLQSGALQHDREFAIFDASGQVINGKRNAKIHALRAQFDLKTGKVALSVPATGATQQETASAAHFQLYDHPADLAAWLGQYFGCIVLVQQNPTGGFPDDTVSPGPTLVSTATLKAIASWYPHLDLEDIRLRFRANIEISGVPAFWEDQLFATADRTVDFQIGSVHLMGVNPCQRCVVVTRNPKTGEADAKFQKTFVTQRQATLPAWVERSRFNHFFRVAVNTRLAESESGKTIAVGDAIKILSSSA